MSLAKARKFEEFCCAFEQDPQANTAELAKRLGISVKSVERYRKQYYDVLNGDSFAGLENMPERAARFLIWLADHRLPVSHQAVELFCDSEFSMQSRMVQRMLEALVKRSLIKVNENGIALVQQAIPGLKLASDDLEQLAAFLEGPGKKGPLAVQLESVLAKIRLGIAGSATCRVIERARKRQTRILVKGPLSAERPEDAGMVELLTAMAEKGKRLLLTYASPQENQDLIIPTEPRGVVFNWLSGDWYLIGANWQTKQIEYYRFDRIHSFQELKQSVSSNNLYDVSAQNSKTEKGSVCSDNRLWSSNLQYAWAMENGPLQQVTVVFEDDFSVHDKVRHDVEGRASAVLINNDDGTLTLHDTVAGFGEFSRWLRQFGASVTVISPLELKTLIRDGALRKLQRYGAEPDQPVKPNKLPGGEKHG